MILENKIGYGYNDISIIPEEITDINSRSQCNPYNIINGVTCGLPIFTAPMSTIVNTNNINIWESNNITPIIPRNINYDKRWQLLQQNYWVALSLKEFKLCFIDAVKDPDEVQHLKPFKGKLYKVCVDLANGHMRTLYETINKSKELAKDNGYTLTIMTGNIANPETYEWVCRNANVDYIRLGIGSGFNCLTSTQTSIHYPVATLIEECYKIKSDIIKSDNINNNDNDIKTKSPYISKSKTAFQTVSGYIEYKSCPYIVADGGIRGYADVIKAIGLGADYVMIGSLFTGLLESAAPLDIECYNSHYKYIFKDNGTVNNGVADVLNIWEKEYADIDTEVTQEDKKRMFIRDMKNITKESYGMSTRKAQRLIDPNAKVKTSEGCTKYIKVKETAHQWTENMIDYFKSAMSYTNKKTIGEFKGHVNFIVNSSCEILAVNK